MRRIDDANRQALLDALPSDAVCCEVGVRRGQFARQILDRTQPRELHLVDCWSEQPDNPDESGRETQAQHDAHHEAVVRTKRTHPLGDRLVIHRGWTRDVLPGLPAMFDWVYIDACHTFKACLMDLHICGEIVKPGGIIAGHDYESGTKWAKDNQCGVVEAVKRFCDETDWVLTCVFVDRHRNNSYMLQRQSA